MAVDHADIQQTARPDAEKGQGTLLSGLSILYVTVCYFPYPEIIFCVFIYMLLYVYNVNVHISL